MDEKQAAAYTRIAGQPNKLVELGSDDCDCDKREPDGPKVPVEDLGAAASLAALLMMLLTRRPPPTGTVPAF